MKRNWISWAVLITLVGAAAVKEKWLSTAAWSAQAAEGRSLPVFEVDRAWPKVPSKWKLGDPSSIAIDRKDNVWVDVPSRFVLRWPRRMAWDRLVLRAQVRRWRRRLPGVGPLVAYICHPMYEQYIELLRPDFVVYHCYDLYQRPHPR